MTIADYDQTTYVSGYGRQPSVTDTEGFDRGTGTGEPSESVAHNLRLMKRADDGFNIRDWDDFLERCTPRTCSSIRSGPPKPADTSRTARTWRCGLVGFRTCAFTTMPTTSSSDRDSGPSRSAS